MPVFQITSIKSGVVLGLYEADDAQGARNAMARGAGFDDEAQSSEVSGADASDFQVTESRSRLGPGDSLESLGLPPARRSIP